MKLCIIDVEKKHRELFTFFNATISKLFMTINPSVVPKVFLLSVGFDESEVKPMGLVEVPASNLKIFFDTIDNDFDPEQKLTEKFKSSLAENQYVHRPQRLELFSGESISRCVFDFLEKNTIFGENQEILPLKEFSILCSSFVVGVAIPKNEYHKGRFVYINAMESFADKITESINSSQGIDYINWGDFTANKGIEVFCNDFILAEIMRLALINILASLLNWCLDNNKNDHEKKIFKGMEYFSLLHSLSTAYVERKDCIGEIIFSCKDNESIDQKVLFEKNDIPSNEIKETIIRKLLTLSSQKGALLCDYNGPYGIGAPLDPLKEYGSFFKVKFTQHGCWEIVYGLETSAKVRYGIPYLRKTFNPDEVKSNVVKALVNFANDSAEKIVSIVEKAESLQKGTTLVFSTNPQEEVQRLQNRGYLIKQIEVSDCNEILENMIPIDGALFFGFDCQCYAIGMILDGTVDPQHHGDRSRGARYNSAKTYIETTKYPAIAIVISEDGKIDALSKAK